jgi:hypothetical protein
MKWKVNKDTADAVLRLTRTPDWITVEKYLRSDVLIELYSTAVAQLSQADRSWHAGRAALLEELLRNLSSDRKDHQTSNYFGGV